MYFYYVNIQWTIVNTLIEHFYNLDWWHIWAKMFLLWQFMFLLYVLGISEPSTLLFNTLSTYMTSLSNSKGKCESAYLWKIWFHTDCTTLLPSLFSSSKFLRKIIFVQIELNKIFFQSRMYYSVYIHCIIIFVKILFACFPQTKNFFNENKVNYGYDNSVLLCA